MIILQGSVFDFLHTGIALACVFITFFIYYTAAGSKPINDWFRIRFGKTAGAMRKTLIQRVAGGVLFGLLPMVVSVLILHISIYDLGLGMVELKKSVQLWITSCILIVVTGFFITRPEKFLRVFPQIRVESWNMRLIVLNALSWFTFPRAALKYLVQCPWG